MPNSKKIHIVKFIKYDKQPILNDIIIRITTSDKILFLYQSQFENIIEILDKIKPGEELTIGINKLENGGYWLYFLFTEDIKLISTDFLDKQKRAINYLIYSFISLLVFTLLLINNSDFMLLFFIISFVITVSFIHEVYIYLSSPINIILSEIKNKEKINKKKTALMIKLINNINNFIYSKYKSFKKIVINKKLKNINFNQAQINSFISAHDIKLEFQKIKNTEKTYNLSFNNPGKNLKIAKNSYEFGDKEKTFFCTTHNKKTDLGYLTVKKHPFFLGKNDHIEVFCDSNKNKVIGIYNHTMKSAYLFLPYGYFNYKEISLPYRFLLPLTIFLSIFSIFSLFSLFSFFFFGSLDFLLLCLFISSIFSFLITLSTLIIFYFKNRGYIKGKKLDKYAIIKQHLLSKLENKENLLIINSIDLLS